MWLLLLSSLLIGANANDYGCPTNVTCIEKETCCQTDTGLWACCPIQDGICCEDGLHCCAKGQKCLPDGKCSSSFNIISSAHSLKLPQNSITDVPCPDGSACPDGNTCCELSSGQYGCCPLADAVCCSDHLHCCPHGYVCDVEHSRCKQQFDNLNDVPCPDGSACPDGNTCCELSSGQYGCCPLADAVCCSDHLHCCPHGYVCDVEHSRCKQQFDNLNDVPCPDGSACPDGNTCCELSSGQYGCCPLADAVCCSDHLHCCPHGYTCNVEKGQCDRATSIPWLKKTPAFRRNHQYADIIDHSDINIYKLNPSSKVNPEIVCPDATTLCPSSSTCCLTPGLQWGCCPIEKAVCCSDHQHCCPEHYKCDLHIFKCDHPITGSIPLLKKQPGLNIATWKRIHESVPAALSTIQCPDQKSYCPEETTCCELQDGSYGCCPYPQASCCSDKIHCCGNGYSCDDSGKRCIRHLSFNQTDTIPSTRKMIALRKQSKIVTPLQLSPLKDQTCPDGKTACSSSSTCCPNKENGEITYSCCPYPKGVCCGSNGSVCCPNGYTCDEKQLSCQLSDSKLLRMGLPKLEYNQCGTSDVACSPDQTCCRTYSSSDGEYGCCDSANAQCCEDGRHCCPEGTRCSLSSGGCIQD